MRYIPMYAKVSPQLFFTTAQDSSWNADKGVTAAYQLPKIVNEGDTIEVLFDMTSYKKWYGDVSNLRFDMFAAPDTQFEIDYVRLYKKNGYVAPPPPEPEKQVAATKPTEAVVKAGENPPEGIKVMTQGGAGTLEIVEDPENKDHKVYAVNCTGDSYTYLDVYMHFKPGATYHATYSLHPLQDHSGNDYTGGVIGGNLRCKTTTESMADHPFATESDRSSGSGWISVDTVITVSADYSATDNDRFRTWGRPEQGETVGISYLVGDISITKAK